MLAAGAIIMIWPLGALKAVPKVAVVVAPATIGAAVGIPVRAPDFEMPEEVVMMPSVLPGTRLCPMEEGNTCKTNVKDTAIKILVDTIYQSQSWLPLCDSYVLYH